MEEEMCNNKTYAMLMDCIYMPDWIFWKFNLKITGKECVTKIKYIKESSSIAMFKQNLWNI